MADVTHTTRTQGLRLAGVIGTSLLIFNMAFYFASALWFEDHKDADITSIRQAFLALSTLVSGASFGAALAPRIVGHLIAVVVGVAALVAGIAALAQGLPGVMGVTLIVLGVVAPVLTLYSLQYSRPAWSVLCSILAVFALVTFFGAPKVRGIMHVGIWTALIAPGLMVIAVIALSMVRSEYRERT